MIGIMECLMPIYEYQCAACNHKFDLLQKLNDAPVNRCTQCFENKAVRLVSAAGFQLQGTGWYVTDFKEKGKAAKTAEVNSETTQKVTETADAATTAKGE
jgi:putative FmdB family regulatory protein